LGKIHEQGTRERAFMKKNGAGQEVCPKGPKKGKKGEENVEKKITHSYLTWGEAYERPQWMGGSNDAKKRDGGLFLQNKPNGYPHT